MAVSSFIGSFTTPTVTGNYAVTGVGFQPKLVYFLTTQTTDSLAYMLSRGVFIDSSNQFTQSNTAYGTIGSGVLNKCRYLSTSHCFTFALSASSVVTKIIEGAGISQDSDGFTINFTTVDATGCLVYFIALAGSDIQSAQGYIDVGTATGTQTVSSLPFQPKAILSFWGSISTEDGSGNGVVTTDGFSQVSGTSNKFAHEYFALSGVATGTATDEKYWTVPVDVGGGPFIQTDGDFLSFTYDGFTFDNSVNVGASYRICYLALGGTAKYHVSSFDLAASTGNQAITGVGFQPVFNLFAGSGVYPISVSYPNLSNFGMIQNGLALGSSNRVTISSNAIAGNYHRIMSTSLINYSGFPALPGNDYNQADFVSFDSDGYTINNTLTSASAGSLSALSIAPAGVTPTGNPWLYYRKGMAA